MNVCFHAGHLVISSPWSSFIGDVDVSGSVHYLSPVSGRSLRLGEMHTYNVRAFGAVGDGVVDDTNAFNSAILTLLAGASGGTLYVPSGVYVLSSMLSFPSSPQIKTVTIMGDGQVSRLLWTFDATLMNLTIPTFAIRHLTIVSTKYQSASSWAINAYTAYYSIVDDVNIFAATNASVGGGIRVVKNASKNTFRAINIEGLWGTGIQMGAMGGAGIGWGDANRILQINILANVSEYGYMSPNNNSYGIHLLGQVSGTTISDCGITSVYYGILTEKVPGATDNWVTSISGLVTVDCYQGVAILDANAVYISNSYFGTTFGNALELISLPPSIIDLYIWDRLFSHCD
eukprot:TRINITY_DN1285_c2_g1_i3.p1 TRINITY_DN1285_c2_g1~~TRINITY_DN1285_c2_g1_i3.p1  ORF type:complete len:345 (+),score=34.58 TRINITY_DN1285_c2_g1_i3:527-1561(+)